MKGWIDFTFDSDYNYELSSGKSGCYILNSDDNEFGPLFMVNVDETDPYYINSEAELDDYYSPFSDETQDTFLYGSDIYLFSSDRSNDKLDIYFSTDGTTVKSFFANSDYNDSYFTWMMSNNLNDTTYNYDLTAYFCSDRDNSSYDIYSVNKSIGTGFYDWLENGDATSCVEKVTSLSSDSNDKCPFILDNIMVFTSDRDGSDFDIYYSKFYDGEWCDAKNIGNLINSDGNEFRPGLYYMNTYYEGYETERLKYVLIFSSDREGGKGGYDLYFIILPIDFF